MSVSKRGSPYRIKLAHLNRPHKVNALQFRMFAHYNLIETEPSDSRLGRPRKGLLGFIDHKTGDMHFINPKPEMGEPIPSSWDWVERALLYSILGRNFSSEELAANIRAEFCTL